MVCASRFAPYAQTTPVSDYRSSVCSADALTRAQPHSTDARAILGAGLSCIIYELTNLPKEYFSNIALIEVIHFRM